MTPGAVEGSGQPAAARQPTWRWQTVPVPWTPTSGNTLGPCVRGRSDMNRTANSWTRGRAERPGNDWSADGKRPVRRTVVRPTWRSASTR